MRTVDTGFVIQKMQEDNKINCNRNNKNNKNRIDIPGHPQQICELGVLLGCKTKFVGFLYCSCK